MKAIRVANLSAPVRRLLSDMERGNRERAILYASKRWRTARAAYLAQHPVCITQGCGQRSTLVDHRDGHQRADWRARFWDPAQWQGMCSACHAAKSARELAAWRRAGMGEVGSGYASNPQQETARCLRSTAPTAIKQKGSE